MESVLPVETIDGETAIVWMRDVIQRLTSGAHMFEARRPVSVASMPLDLLFDDAAMADDYCVTIQHEPLKVASPTQLYVVSRPTAHGVTIPALDLGACSETAFQALANAAGLRVAYPHDGKTWKFFDEQRSVGVQISTCRQDLPPWDATAPLRHHLHWLLDRAGQRFSHAATLGHEGRGVVLFGPGGAGKSGTTLAGLAAGLKTVGDDYVALGLDGGAVARPIFRVVKQDRAGLARNPALATQTSSLPTDWRGKVAFDPSEFFADAFVQRLELGAIILPHIKHSDWPRLYPARAQEVMLALVTSNLHQFPPEMKSGMAFFASLLRRVPCFHLDLSIHAERNGALIKAFITDGFPAQGATCGGEALRSGSA